MQLYQRLYPFVGLLVYQSVGPLVCCSVGVEKWEIKRFRCIPVLHDIGPLGPLPALTLLLQLITPSGASGTADHMQSLDDLFVSFHTSLFNSFYICHQILVVLARSPAGYVSLIHTHQ